MFLGIFFLLITLSSLFAIPTTQAVSFNHSLISDFTKQFTTNKSNVTKSFMVTLMDSCYSFFKKPYQPSYLPNNHNIHPISALKRMDTVTKKKVSWHTNVVDLTIDKHFKQIKKKVRRFKNFRAIIMEADTKNLNYEKQAVFLALVNSASYIWQDALASCRVYKIIDLKSKGEEICKESFFSNENISKLFEVSVNRCLGLMDELSGGNEIKWKIHLENMKKLLELWDATTND